MLTVTATDRAADPTGFTAAVSGSDGAAVSILWTPADRPWPLDDWATAGSRTGDGPVGVLVPPRFYFVCAKTATDCSPPARVAVTDGRTAAATQLQAALAATLKLLNLPSATDFAEKRAAGDGEWTGVGVYEHLLDDPTERRYPCLVVSLDEVNETEETGTSDTDDIVYPFRVMLYDSALAPTNQTVRAWVQWCREKVSRALRQQHVLAVPGSVVCRVRPGPVVRRRTDPPFAGYAGGFTVQCVQREPRGLGA